MERVLYFSGYRLSAYHWKGKKLVGQFSFDPGLGGHEKFDEYLKKTNDIPTRFLLDIIEEDFKQDSIPRIRGKGRADLIQRIEARLFRGAEYAAVISQGKDPEHKRKELVLFSSLMNPEIIKPWLDKLEEWKVPLAGIWSVPMMANAILPYLKINTKHALLISQQVPSSLRQSFYEEGRLVFSRQSKIKFDLREVKDAVSYTVLLANEIEHTEHYLLNHRLVGFNEQISVCCLVRDEFKDEVNDYLESTAVLDYKIFSLKDIEGKFDYKEGHSDFGDILFSRVCHKLPAQNDQYSKPKERRYYDEFIFKKFLYNSSVASVFIAILMTMSMVFDGVAFETEAEEVQAIVHRVDTAYQKEFADNDKILSRAVKIKSAVKLAEAIEKEAKVEPKTFYFELSKIISKTKYSGMFIDTIEWKKESESEAKNFEGRIQPEGYDPYMDVDLNQNNMGSEIQEKVHLAIIKGRVPLGARSYRATIKIINEFILELEKHPQIVSVDVVELPIDLRPTSKYSDYSGVSGKVNATEKVTDGFFSVRVVMQDRVYV